MYEYLSRRSVGHDSSNVTYHSGTCQDFLDRHEADAKLALTGGVRGAREIAPTLFRRIADPRTLRLAWDYLATKGGPAPGPDRRRYKDYTSPEIWEWCRCLASAIREGTYRSGEERVRWVEKASRRGSRPITVLSIADRVVQRAIFQIIQPVLDPLFSAHSMGYRPSLGTWHALSVAEHITQTERRGVWVIEDVRDAFQNVPLSRLLQVVSKLLPADDLLSLLANILPSTRLPGLRQGGSVSGLLLNVYMNHFLDRPWSEEGNPPLIRVADDLLVLCRSESQAMKARSELLRLLIPAALPLKSSDSSIRNLSAGQSADWLGFAITKSKRGLAYSVADRGWTRLDDLFGLAHSQPDAPIHAVRCVIRPWLRHRAPCYSADVRELVCSRLLDAARTHGFEELPGLPELLGFWAEAADRWTELRRRTRQTYRRSGSPIERFAAPIA